MKALRFSITSAYMYTVEPLLKDTLNKGHNTLFYLSVKDKFCGPYSIMGFHGNTILPLKKDSLSINNSKIMPKIAGPKVSVI